MATATRLRWRVRVWTDLDNTSMTEESRADRQQNMTRFAKAFERALCNKCANHEPTVVMTNVGKAPQMRFELFIECDSKATAAIKAHYWISRACTTEKKFSKATGKRGRVALNLPLGRTEVISA